MKTILWLCGLVFVLAVFLSVAIIAGGVMP